MLTRSPHVSFAERVAEMVGPRIRDVFRLRSGKVMAPFTDDAIRKYLARERREDVARLPGDRDGDRAPRGGPGLAGAA
jgi:hypothetical protein